MAASDCKNHNMVNWPSDVMRMKAEKIIVKVYEYFFKILLGLEDKPVEVQSHWQAILVNFSQKDHIDLPPLPMHH